MRRRSTRVVMVGSGGAARGIKAYAGRAQMLYGYKGYPLSTKFPHTEISGLARRFLRNLAVGNRVCLNGLFEQAVENEAARTRRASVEAEHEFVEIVFQLGRLNCSLVCPKEPALEQRRHPMDAWQRYVGRNGIRRYHVSDHRPFMLIFLS